MKWTVTLLELVGGLQSFPESGFFERTFRQRPVPRLGTNGRLTKHYPTPVKKMLKLKLILFCFMQNKLTTH